jgi:hypothetical protein
MIIEDGIVVLIIKLIDGTITPREEAELRKWMSKSEDYRVFVTRMLGKEWVHEDKDSFQCIDKEAMERKMGPLLQREKALEKSTIAPVVTISMGCRLAIAAAVLCLLAGTTWMYIIHSLPTNLADVTHLTLSNGMEIDVEEMTVGSCIDIEEGGKVKKIDQHTLSYCRSGKSKDPMSRAVLYNHTLHVPFGQSWRLEMPEGMEIHLNPGSSLSYPVGINMLNNRTVALQGEATFIVPGRPCPFMVNTDKGDVMVYNGELTVRSYTKEPRMHVTPTSGWVYFGNGKNRTKLRAGYEGSVDKTNGMIRVMRSEVAMGMFHQDAWINTTNLTLPQVLSQIKDWYGADTVIIEDGVDTKTVGLLGGGHFKKGPQLKALLEKFSMQHMQLVLKGNKILVRNCEPTEVLQPGGFDVTEQNAYGFVNLPSGWTSVREVIDSIERATQLAIHYDMGALDTSLLIYTGPARIHYTSLLKMLLPASGVGFMELGGTIWIMKR